MSDVVVVALLTLIGNCIVSLFGILTSNKLTTYRLEQLEQEVRKHNSVVDRVYALEKKNEVQDEQMKENTRRIDDVERDIYNLQKAN